jgi:hypothetical protein
MHQARWTPNLWIPPHPYLLKNQIRCLRSHESLTVRLSLSIAAIRGRGSQRDQPQGRGPSRYVRDGSSISNRRFLKSCFSNSTRILFGWTRLVSKNSVPELWTSTSACAGIEDLACRAAASGKQHGWGPRHCSVLRLLVRPDSLAEATWSCQSGNPISSSVI